MERLHGLWEKDVKRYPHAVYGGVRIQSPAGMSNQVAHLFPRIQTALRRNVLSDHNSPENDLYQWHKGSKYCGGILESFVTLEQEDQVIEVKVRGPEDMRTNLFYFFEDVIEVIQTVVEDCCPGLDFERHILSAKALREHRDFIPGYSPRRVLKAQLGGNKGVSLDGESSPSSRASSCKNLNLTLEEDEVQGASAPEANVTSAQAQAETKASPPNSPTTSEPDQNTEAFTDLVCFGSDEIAEFLTLGPDLHISHLSIHTRRLIASKLDPPDPMGRDWCLLAVSLGLQDTLPRLDRAPHPGTHSKQKVVQSWSYSY